MSNIRKEVDKLKKRFNVNKVKPEWQKRGEEINELLRQGAELEKKLTRNMTPSEKLKFEQEIIDEVVKEYEQFWKGGLKNDYFNSISA